MTAVQRLLAAFAERGHAARAVPVEVLGDLRAETDARFADGSLAPALRALYLPDGFDHDLVRRDPALRSIVVVATPSPQVRLTFHSGGRARAVHVGPTYVDRGRILSAVKDLAAGVLGPAGHRTAAVGLPKKLLAARAGLGCYGRNNLLYVHGAGSFHRLTAFATDAPCPEDATWEPPRLLARCDRCTACVRACPTGAIGADRFLLRAERCLAFFNEKPLPFPPWLGDTWDDCLVGCMACQRTCPENRRTRPRTVDAASFSEEETASLLQAAGPEALPAPLREKLGALALLHYAAVMPRNARMSLRAAR